MKTDILQVSVVIPVFNEKNILVKNLESLASYFDGAIGIGKWMFIIVDNGSTDGTIELVKSSVQRWSPSQAVFLNEPNYGAALKAGLRAATTKWVYLLDIEQWDFPFMTWAWNNRSFFDVFLGSKRADLTLNHQAPYRRILSAGLNAILQLFFKFSGSDTHGPKLLNRQSLKSIIDVCELDRGQFDTELVLRSIRTRKRIIEIPVEYRESRPHRNLMMKKIYWNVRALMRLHRVLSTVPFEGEARYYRFTREEVNARREISEVLPDLRELVEMQSV